MSCRGVLVCLLWGTLLAGFAQAQTADYFVAKNGNDSWSGTLAAPNGNNTDGPFLTIQRAQTAVRAILANPGGRTNPVTVMVRQGTYWESTPVEFNSSDAGTSQLQVIWENYTNETPAISGGKQITGWTNTGGNQWQVTLASGTPNFEALFYNGERRFRPRLGSSTSNLGTYYRVLSTIYVAGSPPPSPPPNANCSVYVSGSGWECFDRFTYNSSDPMSKSWKNLAPPKGNPCNQTAGNGNLVGDIELMIFEQWNVSRLRINCVDTSNHIVYLTGPTNTTDPTYHGFLPNHRYIVENVQDDLQQPGQWFLNRANKSWVLTYLANSGENPNTDTVVIPQSSQVLVASQLQYVTFQGITFQNDNYVPPAGGYPSAQGDFGITAAVSCQNCQNVVFNQDTVTQTTGGGLELIPCIDSYSPTWCVTLSANGATSHNTIENSAFYDIGSTGLRIGSAPLWQDTDATVPQAITVQNNVIEGVSRMYPSAFAISQGSGHGNTYTHNDIYDSYHSAIAICEYSCPPGHASSTGSFNNIVSYNHVYNLMQGLTSDTGAIYFNTGGPTFISTGNQILNNRIHDVNDASVLDGTGYGGFGIKLDSNTGSMTIENNVVYRTTDTSMSTTCGPQLANNSNIIKNNVFSYSKLNTEGVSCAAAAGANQFSFTNNLIFISKSNIQFGCTYCPAGGNCLPTVQKYSSNMYCDISSPTCTLSSTPFRTTTSTCSETKQDLSWSGWQGLNEDVKSMNTNPLFTNPFYPTDDFSLQSGSPASQVGFVPFDISQAGRTSDNINPPAVPATFITGTYSATTTITMTSSLKPSSYGEPVTFTATMSSKWGPPPDGTEITFTDTSDNSTLGTASSTQGSASLQLSNLSVGTHQITASFSATAYWPATTSNTLWQQVQKGDSATAVKSNINPSNYGQSVNLTATVTASGGTPTGSVKFNSGNLNLGTVTLSSGVATLATTKMQVGTDSVTAKYLGDTNFAVSTSPGMNQTVNQASSQTTLTSSPNPSTQGQAVTFTATVTSPNTTPTGQVTFKSGSTTLGTKNLNSSGVATLSDKSLPVGTDSIIATYNGNTNVAGSTSKTLKQVVNK